MEWCRRQHWQVGQVSQRIPVWGASAGGLGSSRATITRDLWSFGDLLVCQPGIDGPLIVQTTTHNQRKVRVRKILGECEAEAMTWIRASGRIEVWGWRKNAKGRWQPTIIRVEIKDGKLQARELADITV